MTSSGTCISGYKKHQYSLLMHCAGSEEENVSNQSSSRGHSRSHRRLALLAGSQCECVCGGGGGGGGQRGM